MSSEKLDHLTPEMEKTVEDIRLFRKAASHYEFKEMDQAEEIVNGLMERYPDAPGFLKFKCRFVTARAKQNRKFSEADEFLEKCLQLFPDDGYFMKYKGDMLWEKGLQNEALVEYAKQRSTTNGIVQLELDKLLCEKKDMAIEEV